MGKRRKLLEKQDRMIELLCTSLRKILEMDESLKGAKEMRYEAGRTLDLIREQELK